MLEIYKNWLIEKGKLKDGIEDKSTPPLRKGGKIHKICIDEGLCSENDLITDMSLFEYFRIYLYLINNDKYSRTPVLNDFLAFKVHMFASKMKVTDSESVLGITALALASAFEFKATDLLATIISLNEDDIASFRKFGKNGIDGDKEKCEQIFQAIFEDFFSQSIRRNSQIIYNTLLYILKRKVNKLYEILNNRSEETGSYKEKELIFRERVSKMGNLIFEKLNNSEGFHGSEFEVFVYKLRGAVTRFYDGYYDYEAENKLTELVYETLIAATKLTDGFTERNIAEPKEEKERNLLSAISPFIKLADKKNLNGIFSNAIAAALLRMDFLYAFREEDEDVLGIYSGLTERIPLNYKGIAVVNTVCQSRDARGFLRELAYSVKKTQICNLSNVNNGIEKLNTELFNVPNELMLLISAYPNEEKVLEDLLHILALDYGVKIYLDNSVSSKQKALYAGKLCTLLKKYYNETINILTQIPGISGLSLGGKDITIACLEYHIGELCMDCYAKDNKDENALTRSIVAFRTAAEMLKGEDKVFYDKCMKFLSEALKLNAKKLEEEEYPKEFLKADYLPAENANEHEYKKNELIKDKAVHNALRAGTFSFYVPMKIDDETFYNSYFLGNIDSETAARKRFGAMEYEKPLLTTLMSGQNIVFTAPQIIDTDLRKLADIPEYLQLFQSGFLSVSFFSKFTNLSGFCIDRLKNEEFQFSSMPFLNLTGNKDLDTEMVKCRNKIADCLKEKKIPPRKDFDGILGANQHSDEICEFISQIIRLDENIPSFYKCYHFQHHEHGKIADTLLEEWLNHDYTQKKIFLPEQYRIHKVIERTLHMKISKGVIKNYDRSNYLMLLDEINDFKSYDWSFENDRERKAFEDIINGDITAVIKPMYDILGNNYNIALSSCITPFSKSSYDSEIIMPSLQGTSINRKKFEKKTYNDFTTVGINGPAVNISDAVHYVYALREIIRESSNVSKLISTLNNSPEISPFAQYDFMNDGTVVPISASIETTTRKKMTVSRDEATNREGEAFNLITEEK